MDAILRVGQPVFHRHVYGLQDVDSSVAKKCPACWDEAYSQTRFDCPVCYGQGFVSVENNPDTIWITQAGLLIEQSSPDSGWIRAPRYGGFGKPTLTYVIQPDIAVDVFRLNDIGALVQQYDSKAFAPWNPTMGDNDILIDVDLWNGDDFTNQGEYDRFSIKMAEQMTVRGQGKNNHGSKLGQPFLLGQTFEMTKVPLHNVLNNVPADEIWY